MQVNDTIKSDPNPDNTNPNNTNDNQGNFFSNAWNNTIYPFIDREWTYLKNGWSLTGIVFIVAALVGAIVVGIFMGMMGAPIASMIAISGGGIGVWLYIKGRGNEEGKVVWSHLAELKKAFEELSKMKTDDANRPEKIKSIQHRMSIIENYKDLYNKIDDIGDGIRDWMRAEAEDSKSDLFNNTCGDIEGLQGTLAKEADVNDKHKQLASNEWKKFIKNLEAEKKTQ